MIESKEPKGIFLNQYDYIPDQAYSEKVFMLPITPDQEKQIEDWKKIYPDAIVTFVHSQIKIKRYENNH